MSVIGINIFIFQDIILDDILSKNTSTNAIGGGF